MGLSPVIVKAARDAAAAGGTIDEQIEVVVAWFGLMAVNDNHRRPLSDRQRRRVRRYLEHLAKRADE